MARPTKLTPEVQERIVSAIRAGCFAETAAEYAGISASTFYEWMERGRRAEAGYKEFFEAVQQALAEAEVVHVGRVSKAAHEGDWRASAWWLSRRCRDRWAQVVPQEPKQSLADMFELIRSKARGSGGEQEPRSPRRKQGDRR